MVPFPWGFVADKCALCADITHQWSILHTDNYGPACLADQQPADNDMCCACTLKYLSLQLVVVVSAFQWLAYSVCCLADAVPRNSAHVPSCMCALDT